MTKDERNKLTWRLKELPSAEAIAALVEAEVLEVEEAREILLGSSTDHTEKIKALEEQVEFLRDLVTELSKNKTTTTFVPFTRTITYANTPYWAKTNEVLCKAGLTMSSTTGNVSSGTGTFAVNVNAANLSKGTSSLNKSYTLTATGDSSTPAN